MALDLASTKTGLVSGVPLPGKDITVFKGIPFAAPPVGELRWKAPQPAAPWTGVRPADRFMPPAWQEYHQKGSFYDREWGHKPFERSEDCLYLNVWTPAKSADEKLPVAVWIFGGGYMSGFAHENEFDGEAFSSKGVVYVSINYRLNVFGFLAHPDLDQESGRSGNYGTLDQVAALHWVHENIAAFGGDPGNVFIYGQSAGAGSVVSLVYSPLMKGIVQRAAAHSGLSNFQSKEAAYYAGQTFVEHCGNRSPLELRDMPAEELLDQFTSFFPKYMADPKAKFLPFGPYIDGYVLQDSFENLTNSGRFNDVQFILGSTKDDMAGNIPFPWMPAGLNKSMRDYGFKLEELGRKPAYLYFFQRPMPGDDSGSWHSCDLWYIHGTLKNCWRPFEAVDYKISDAMITYWTNFVKSGDPNGAGLPEWKPLTKADPFTMVFDAEIGRGEAEFNPNPDTNNARWRIQDHH
jgi:para-nitrobenzyl esterase